MTRLVIFLARAWRWLWGILVWLDQGLNVILHPLLNALMRPNPAARFGHPDETLSSVMGKNVRAGQCKVCKWICLLLHRFDPHHCEKSIEHDRHF